MHAAISFTFQLEKHSWSSRNVQDVKFCRQAFVVIQDCRLISSSFSARFVNHILHKNRDRGEDNSPSPKKEKKCGSFGTRGHSLYSTLSSKSFWVISWTQVNLGCVEFNSIKGRNNATFDLKAEFNPTDPWKIYFPLEVLSFFLKNNFSSISLIYSSDLTRQIH